MIHLAHNLSDSNDVILDMTEDGYPIVGGDYSCSYWVAGKNPGYQMRECWYCRFADFRKNTQFFLEKSVCHNPLCRGEPSGKISPNHSK